MRGFMKNLNKITGPPSLANLAYDKLRKSILDGELEPGKLYVEMNLARELGISRTPTREALLELSAQGLVTFLPRKGVVIKHFTARDVEEVFELRNLIEIATVEKVCQRAKVLDFSKVEKALTDQYEMAKKADTLGFIEADRAFHAQLAELAQNRLFIITQENLRDKIHVMATEGLKQPGRMEEVMKEHKKILESIRLDHVDEAKQAMDLHLDRSRQAVIEQYQSFKEIG
jgi:DNA-binding GntR family transcriptional regulator